MLVHCSRQLQSQEGEETSALDAYSSNWRQAAFAQFRGLSNSESPENAPGPGRQFASLQI